MWKVNRKDSNFQVVLSSMVLWAIMAFFFNWWGNMNLKSSLIDSWEKNIIQEKVSEKIDNVDKVVYEYNSIQPEIRSEYSFENQKIDDKLSILELKIWKDLDAWDILFSSNSKITIIDKYAVTKDNKIINIK